MINWSCYYDTKNKIIKRSILFPLLEKLNINEDYSSFFDGINFFEECLKCNKEEQNRLFNEIHNLISTKPQNSPFYYESMRLSFLTDKENQIKQLKWWKICIDQEDLHIEYYFNLSKHDREKEVKDILGIGEDGKGSLRDFFKSESGKIFAQISSRWFMIKRYDVRITRKIIYNLLDTQDESKPINNFVRQVKPKYEKIYNKRYGKCHPERFYDPKKLFGKLYNYADSLDKIYLFLKKHVFWSLLCILFFSILLVIKWKKGVPISLKLENPNLRLYSTSLPSIIICFFYAYALSYIIKILKMPEILILLLPRLICIISIGFLALTIEDLMWKYIIKMDPLLLFIFVFFIVIIAFIYIRNEIGNIIGRENERDRKKVFKRTFILLIMGILYSLFLGFIIMDVICGQLMNIIDLDGIWSEIRFASGFFGVIQLKLWIFFSFASMLIGIFVQLIWEDKSITYPL